MSPLTHESIFNKTSIFLMPLAFEPGTKYKNIIDKDFVNAYVADIDKPEYDGFDTVQLLYSGTKYKTIGELTRYNKDIDGKKHTIYVMPTSKEFVDDAAIFFMGKYSEMSDDAKQRILDFWEENERTELYGILHKDSELIHKRYKPYEKLDESNGNELWPPLELNEEIIGLQQ